MGLPLLDIATLHWNGGLGGVGLPSPSLGSTFRTRFHRRDRRRGSASPAIALDQTHQAAAALTASVATVAVVLPQLDRRLLSAVECGHAVPASSCPASRPSWGTR